MTNLTALIIDDNANNITVLQQLLRMEGVASERLSTAKELASELDRLTNIAVVFLDLEMPVVDGYEAVSIIRAHPNFQTAKVVAYSVHVSELKVVMGMEFDAFLGKPLDADAFPEQLSRILAGEKLYFIP
jgi:CheY-like chemotaxis protein